MGDTHTHTRQSKNVKKPVFDELSKKGEQQSINPLLLFMYDACALGYLVTLFSISNRRSRVSCRDRASRSREARVEPRVKAEASNAPGLGGQLPAEIILILIITTILIMVITTTTWEKSSKMAEE